MDIKKILPPSCVLGLLASTVLLLSGCGKNYTAAEAQHFFSAHRAQLEELVNEIRGCKYATQISSNPHANGPVDSQCVNQNSDYRDHIAKQLAKLNILWVTVDWWENLEGGKQKHRFDGVSFVLTSHGIVGSGTGSAIWYFTKPISNPSEDMVPLTDLPSQWFFKLLGQHTKEEGERQRFKSSDIKLNSERSF